MGSHSPYTTMVQVWVVDARLKGAIHLVQAPLGGLDGLLGIRERATLVDGEVEIISAPGSGTTLVVHIAELWQRANL